MQQHAAKLILEDSRVRDVREWKDVVCKDCDESQMLMTWPTEGTEGQHYWAALRMQGQGQLAARGVSAVRL